MAENEYQNELWDKAKADILRIYIRENKSLKSTMEEIKEKYKFSKSETSWTRKLNEWGYWKNARDEEVQWFAMKKMKRKLEGKDTEFYKNGFLVPSNKFENPKKRRTGRIILPQDATTPPGITYTTPSSSKDGCSAQQTNDATPLYFQCERIKSDSIASHEISAEQFDEELLGRDTTQTSSILEEYLYGGEQSWTPVNLSHQLGDHVAALDKLKEIVIRVASDATCEEQNPLDLSFHVFNSVSDHPAPNDSVLEGWDAEEAAILDDLICAATKLASYQCQYEEFAPETLRQEFEMAKISERYNNLEEAEYHCRRILDQNFPQIDVETFLGMIYADTMRLEEATWLLFVAITAFIDQFSVRSPREMEICIRDLEVLFAATIGRDNGPEWKPLISDFNRMTLLVQIAIMEGTTNEVSTRLLLKGFSIAHQCSNLDLVRPAKYIYEILLESIPTHLNAAVYGIERAIAHRTYGNLLRNEGRWKVSAEQLRLACEFAMSSDNPSVELIAQLKSDNDGLAQHMTDTGSDLMEQIKTLLLQIETQWRSRTQKFRAAVQKSRVKEYFMSDLPFSRLSSALDPGSLTRNTQFETGSVTTESAECAHEEDDHTSARSSSGYASHRFGLTWSSGSITGVSDPLCGVSGFPETFIGA